MSYGEYVAACGAADLAPVRAREEQRTRRYLASIDVQSTGPLGIVGQEANCIETGKAARPHLVYVETVLDVSRTQRRV